HLVDRTDATGIQPFPDLGPRKASISRKDIPQAVALAGADVIDLARPATLGQEPESLHAVADIQEIADHVEVPDRKVFLSSALDRHDASREVRRDIPGFARADQEERTATNDPQPVRFVVQPPEMILRQFTDGVRTRGQELVLLGDRPAVTTGPVLG